MVDDLSDVGNLIKEGDLSLNGANNNASNGNGQADNASQNEGKGAGKSDAELAAEKLKADNEAKAAAEKKEADDKLKADEAAKKNEDDAKKPEAVELDGVKYKLDAEGNALGEDGKVFKTKAELDEIEAEANEIPVVEEFINRIGIKPLDDKGKPKVYEDSIEGLVSAATDVGKELGRKEQEDIINSDPEFKEFLEYKRTGGNLQDFINMQQNSWSKVKLDENNEEQLVNVIMADLIAGGMPEDQAKLTTSMYKDGKRLKEFGKIAYDKLVGYEKQVEKERVDAFNSQVKQQQESVKAHWTNVESVINKGVLHNVVIPETDKKGFYEYLAIAVDDKGNSKKLIERSKLPLEQLLLLDYYAYKGFNLNELITKAVRADKVKSLRSRIKNNDKPNIGGGEGIDTTKYGKPADFNVNVSQLE